MEARRVEGPSIEPLAKDAMPELEDLFRRVYGFSAAETVPAWLMYTSSRQGGLVLGAWCDGRLVGGTYAAPAYDRGEATLWWVQLAVAPEYRSRGLGERLKRAQRRAALELGYRRIRACTDVLASHLLALYVARVPGRVVAYHPDLYAGITSGAVHGGAGDEVELEWDLHDPRWDATARSDTAELPPLLTVTDADPRGTRRLRSTHAPAVAASRAAIELPWSGETLKRERPEEARRWREGIRPLIQELLGSSYRGTDVISDRTSQRAYLIFERAGSPPGKRLRPSAANR